MKLSIVIPLYNKEKYIDRCLLSLLNQDLLPTEYEIIVIDDGSTDSGGDIVNAYAEKHANILLINQQNKGVSAARNKGLEIAQGEYIYFLDADDYLAANVLKDITKLSQEYNLDVLGFKTKATQDGNLNESTTPILQNPALSVMDGITYIAKHGYRNEVWWYLVKRSFLLDNEMKFVEGRYMEDSVFTTNVFVKANRVAKVNMDVHRFVKVANSIQTSTNYPHMLKFIDDLVFAIEEVDLLIKNLDNSHEQYSSAIKEFNKKQQSYVFTLFIKAFRCPPLKIGRLKKILTKLNQLNVYPINLKKGGIGNRKTRLIYNMTAVPIFNNKFLFFSTLRIKRLVAS